MNRRLLPILATCIVAANTSFAKNRLPFVASAEKASTDQPINRSTPSKARPNIVVLFADDLGFSDIGCFGSEIETPNLDALAENGLRFTNFYNTGRCCPSRASILTGLYAHQAGIGHMAGATDLPAYQDHLSKNAVTLAEVLGNAGYHTIMTGKWHVGWRDDGSPTARGFDKFYGTRGYIDSYYTVIPRTEVYLDDQLIIPVTKTPINHHHPDQEWYTTDVFTDYALHFIDQHLASHQSKNQRTDQPTNEKTAPPFFLYLAYNAPHFPLHAKPEDTKKYRGKYREGWQKFREQRHQALLKAGILDKSAALSPLDVPDWNSLTEEQQDDLDFKMALYAAIVDRPDQNVGRVVNHLRDIGQLDNTLIVFVSDNGGTKETGLLGIKGDAHTVDNYDDWARVGGWSSSYGQGWANLSNAPFRRYKRENHEGGISTPFIVHWPNGIEAKGEIRHQVAHLIDLMPTFVEAAGAEYPNQFDGHNIQPMEGQSLIPAFASRKAPPRTLFFEHENNRAIRDGNFKLVAQAGAPWELYDMSKDRAELIDLSKINPAIFKKLKAKWQTWADRVGVVDASEVREARQKYNRRRNDTRKQKPAPAP
ncbi:MAG: arylsulfatase [Verrucomicrobiota bacterium]